MIKTNIPYKLVRKTKEQIIKKPLDNGAIYFATDTGEIFLDTETERILYNKRSYWKIWE